MNGPDNEAREEEGSNPNTASEPGQPIPSTGPVTIEIEADPTLGYASIQNAVPVMRALRLTNNGPEALEARRSTRELQSALRRRDHAALRPLGARANHAESRRIDLRRTTPTWRDLAGAARQQLRRGASRRAILSWRARQQDGRGAGLRPVGGHPRACPNCSQLSACRTIRPSMCLIHKASATAEVGPHDLSMNGYQSKNREVVWKQISARLQHASRQLGCTTPSRLPRSAPMARRFVRPTASSMPASPLASTWRCSSRPASSKPACALWCCSKKAMRGSECGCTPGELPRPPDR
jgi:hypothetical protein